MKIRVHEIPSEGKTYSFDRSSGELNSVLSDLIGGDYSVDVNLVPQGTFYEIKGELQTRVPNICSLCGEDLESTVRSQFNDLMIEKLVDDRGSQYSKGSGIESGDGTEVAYFSEGVFDLGEYVHEMFALEIPDYPECGQADCSEKSKALMEKFSAKDEEFEETQGKGHPGFKALEGLKLN